MNKANQKRAMRLIGSTVKTLNFTSNMIGLRAVINPMNYPILQLYANLNHAKAQIDEVQALLDPDRIRKLKEMGHWPVPKEALTEEDKLRAELKKAKAQIRKLKEEQAVSRKVLRYIASRPSNWYDCKHKDPCGGTCANFFSALKRDKEVTTGCPKGLAQRILDFIDGK